MEEIPCKVEKFSQNSFSKFHLNIRSLNKAFEKLLEFLSIMKNKFDVTAISEKWCSDYSINVNLLYHISNYIPTHQIQKSDKNCVGLALYSHQRITFIHFR